jgi:hypothetical protein
MYEVLVGALSFFQHLDRGLVAVDDGLGSEPQLQRVVDANEAPFARADHPVAQRAAADRNAGALEGFARR